MRTQPTTKKYKLFNKRNLKKAKHKTTTKIQMGNSGEHNNEPFKNNNEREREREREREKAEELWKKI